MQLPDVSDGPIFSLAREKIGEKRVLGYVWCSLPLNLGNSQCFGRRSTRDSPYGRLGMRRLIRNTRFDGGCLRIFAVNRRCRPDLPVCTFLHWISLFASRPVGAGLCSARLCLFCRKHGRSSAPPPQNAPQRLPSQGPIPPIRGKCPEGTKGVGTLSAAG